MKIKFPHLVLQPNGTNQQFTICCATERRSESINRSDIEIGRNFRSETRSQITILPSSKKASSKRPKWRARKISPQGEVARAGLSPTSLPASRPAPIVEVRSSFIVTVTPKVLSVPEYWLGLVVIGWLGRTGILREHF